jgi:hypothetical protein
MNKSRRFVRRIFLAGQLFVVILIMFLLGSCERDDDIQPEYGVPGGELKSDNDLNVETVSFHNLTEHWHDNYFF